MKLHTIHLEQDQYELIKSLIEFHVDLLPAGDDESGDDLPFNQMTFIEICEKFNVEVPPNPADIPQEVQKIMKEI